MCKGYYQRARDRADTIDRPLVVVGAPAKSMSQYRCGDVPCVDINGCKSCKAPPRDVTVAGAIALEDDSAVVFSPYVLEYVDNPEAAMAEMQRVAGSPENMYIPTIQDWATGTRVMTGAKHQINRMPWESGTGPWFHSVRKTFVATQKKRKVF